MDTRARQAPRSGRAAPRPTIPGAASLRLDPGDEIAGRQDPVKVPRPKVRPKFRWPQTSGVNGQRRLSCRRSASRCALQSSGGGIWIVGLGRRLVAGASERGASGLSSGTAVRFASTDSAGSVVGGLSPGLHAGSEQMAIAHTKTVTVREMAISRPCLSSTDHDTDMERGPPANRAGLVSVLRVGRLCALVTYSGRGSVSPSC